MSNSTNGDALPAPTQNQPTSQAAPAAPPRLWPAIFLVAAFWAYSIGSEHIEMITFVRFLARMAAAGLFVLSLTIWWLMSGRISRRKRFLGLLITAAGGIAASFFVDKTIGVFGIVTYGLPCVFTAATLWMLIARWIPLARPQAVGIAVVLCTWAYFPLIRMDGLSGEQQAAIHWRWSPTAEELFLAERAQARAADDAARAQDAMSDESADSETLALQPGDWPGFRGPNRDAVVHGAQIRTDWNTSPPRRVWKQRVGPGWSSMAIVGDRLFTQEQRGESEAVVCLDAHNGREIWVHEDTARFSDNVAGAGPRATPLFDAAAFTPREPREYSIASMRRPANDCGRTTWRRNRAQARNHNLGDIQARLSHLKIWSSCSPGETTAKGCSPIAPTQEGRPGAPRPATAVTARRIWPGSAASRRYSLSMTTG